MPKVCVLKEVESVRTTRRCLEIIFTSLIAAMNQCRINPRKQLRKSLKICVLVSLVNHSTQKIKTSNQKKGKSQVESNLTRDMV